MKPFIAWNQDGWWQITYMSKSLGCPRWIAQLTLDKAYRWLERAYKSGDVAR